MDLKGDADYMPSMLGPYSEPAEISLRNLRSYTLFDESGNKLDDKGKKIAEVLEESISLEYRDAISYFKDFSNDLTKDELLLFIYLYFPDFTVESLILSNVIKNKISNIVSLYKKGKMSLAKAASLAGVCIEDKIDREGRQDEKDCSLYPDPLFILSSSPLHRSLILGIDISQVYNLPRFPCCSGD
ncbi:MAG TPA: hypothetical protein PLY52_02355 [Methanothrix sp.]|uniref:hypothetical protein n=1 Tax=Methanothrix sp. TaxID=90426 RepID=UPI002C1AB915|nr:hypothetical protein [Methanothrix sp.]MDI9418305.1 hypothetical protein [Euryarchaeota archaeon]HON35137.1 hypothetical protein [Methanothrix sp.]HRU74687.1 hypothetical protein [Methanothrix sp.]